MPSPHHQSLCEVPWQVRAVGDVDQIPAAARREVPARIPGCVHTDLMAAGVIGDPAVGFNEREQQWIGLTDWEYRCSFETEAALLAHERIDLVCDGLDTIATVELNGVVIGAAANMFHPHRFDARAGEVLRQGRNELVIRFKSAIRHIREEQARLGARPVNGDWDPYIFIRKAACNFGWDWGPRVATCGVWKPIRLEGWSGVRIAGMRPRLTRGPDERWAIEIGVDLDWGPRATEVPYYSLGANLRSGENIFGHAGRAAPVGQPTLMLRMEIAQAPSLWWPRGHGPQVLYSLEISIARLLDEPPLEALDSMTTRVAFREVGLDISRDDEGSRFAIRVNGRPIFCKGANWIPEGLLPARMTREKYRERLRQAADANMNMLRVWGGGFYESDDFYDLCDELGILVWQDFMFACAMYPEEAPYPALIEAEARHQIARLSSHPSVALWCGGNECVWAYESWGRGPGETKTWKERLGQRTWGRGYYFDLLPRLMAELDPTRPYWPNSPWSGSESVGPNEPGHGDRHTWDVRGEGYRTIVPRFCSEFGHQSPSNYATLAAAVGAENLKLGSPALAHRQRATGGTATHIDEMIAELFRPPRDFEEWHYLAQLAQARALKTGIEWMRVNQPRCTGTLIWQFNDAWPGMSWSLVDSGGRRKLAWYAVREAFNPTLLTIQPIDGRPTLFGINDTNEARSFSFLLHRSRLDGRLLASKGGRFEGPPHSVQELGGLAAYVGEPADETGEFVSVMCGLSSPFAWFYRPDRELAYPRPEFSLSRRGSALWIETKTLVRDLVIACDRSDPPLPWNAQPLTLSPHVTMRISDLVEDDRLLRLKPEPPLVWCANWFGQGA